MMRTGLLETCREVKKINTSKKSASSRLLTIIVPRCTVNEIYVGKSISELQIQVETHVFELSAGNCHR